MRALKQLGTARGTMPEGVYLRGSVYWIRAAHAGRRVRRPGGRTLEEALAARERLLAELADSVTRADELRGPTIDSVAEAYLEYLKLDAKPSSLAGARSALGRVRAVLGSTRAAELTGEKLDAYQSERFKLVSKATVNREVRCLRAALRKAVERKKLATIPVRFKMLRTPRKSPAILTPEQVHALLDAAQDLRPLLATAVYTGLRSGELCALRHRDVGLAAGVIRVSARDGWAPKSYRDREVEIHPALRKALGSLLQGEPEDRLFMSPRGCAWEPTSLSKAVRPVFVRAGLYDPANKPGLHMLRRTFVSTLLHGGTDVETARELAGHSSIMVTGMYAATTSAIKRKAIEGLGF